MEQTYRYSPLPIDSYIITQLNLCPARAIKELDRPLESAAVWNLCWLSVPAVDVLPEHGSNPDFYMHYQVDVQLWTAIAMDVMKDEVLLRKVVMHPSRFSEWFRREDHTIYDTFGVSGAEWVSTVLARSDQAAARMASEVPAIRDKSYLSFLKGTL